MADIKKEIPDNQKTDPKFQSTLSVASKDVKHEEAYYPFEHRHVEHPNTTFGSIVHLLKGCIGSGVLAMPAAFKHVGLATGSIGTLLVGLICTNAMYMLVKTSQEVCVDAKKPLVGFAETCGAAFTYGPKRLRPWGGFVQTLMDYSMSLTYFSVLSVYVVFIASSFKEVLDVYIPEVQLSIQAYCALTLVPLVLICQIRNLKYLVPFSIIANVLIVMVFIITLYYVFVDLPPVRERDMVADVTQWPLFLSTVVFAIQGIGVVMPIENEMQKPQKFLGCPGVLNITMIIVVSIHAIVGFFGYLQYGDKVKGSVTLNLPQNEMIPHSILLIVLYRQYDSLRKKKKKKITPVFSGFVADSVVCGYVIRCMKDIPYMIAQSAKILMALVIFFSFALLFYVPMEMINRHLQKRNSNSNQNFLQISVRTFLVTCAVAIAAAFPNLELVISFVGAIFFSTLGLLAPAVVDTVYRWDRDLGIFNYILFKNIIIGMVSIIALVSGSYISVVKMVEEFFKNGTYVNKTST